MGQIKRDCPHCHTKNTAFLAFGEYTKSGSNVYTTAFYCSGCFSGVIAEIKLTAGQSPLQYHGDIDENPNQHILKLYPKPQETKIPKNLPANINRFFMQASDSFKASSFDASSMMSRKTLEVAVKTLEPTATGNLYKRIESLAKQNLITPDLKDWAHIIRDDGNTAAHEEDPVTKEHAEELLAFTEMFLMYTFTMPSMVKEKRKDDTQEQQA